MKRLIGLLLASVVAGCGDSAVESTGEYTGPPQIVECSGKPDGAACDSGDLNKGACNAGTCVKYNACNAEQDGEVCGGSPADDFHARCLGGQCAWKDYQCLEQINGAACAVGAGGAPTPGTCSFAECCTFCVDADGACKIVHVPDQDGPVITGGVVCP